MYWVSSRHAIHIAVGQTACEIDYQARSSKTSGHDNISLLLQTEQLGLTADFPQEMSHVAQPACAD
jgi:hypothetical protein